MLDAKTSDLIDQCFWWHSIQLSDTFATPGLKSLEQMEVEFALTFRDIDLHDKRVLDIGAWNGGFTAEAARRGAAHITAIDHVTWNNPAWKGRLSFDLVVKALDLPTAAFDIDLDVPSLSLAHIGKFDVVLFLGVFYHLRDPLAALREAANLATEVLVVETYVDRSLDPRPLMLFYPSGSGLHGDPSTWWGPSCACMEMLLRSMGFNHIESFEASERDRQVFHARR